MASSILPQSSGGYHAYNSEDWENNQGEATTLRPDGIRPQAAALPAKGSRVWHRVGSTLAFLAGFGVVALVLHEFFHFVTLRALGGDGYITFDMELGLTHFNHLPSRLWAVHLSGGLLTGVFLLVVFWFWSWSSRSVQNTNIEVSAFAWALGSLAYAPTELLASSPAMGLTAFGIGFSVAGLVYFVKLMDWVASPE